MIFFSSTNKSVTKQPFFNFVLCRNADDCCRVIIHTPMTQHNLLLVCYLFVDKNFFFGLCFVLLPPSLSLSVVCIIPKSLLLKILSRNLLLCVYFVLICWALFFFFFWMWAGVEKVDCCQWTKRVIVRGTVKPEVVLKRVRKVKGDADLITPPKK